MSGQLWVEDVKTILSSKRTSYTIIIMAVFAIGLAIVVEFSPEGLKRALEAAAPASSGVFEYMWFEDFLDKLFLLVIVSFGAFAICDLEDNRMVELTLSRAQTRLEVIFRRLTASLISFLLVFAVGSIIVSIIARAIIGEMDIALFLLHQLFILPMCLFVFSLTFLLSVPLRTTTSTAITSFAISLALSFTYTFLVMAGDSTPSIFNPLALGHRILVELPLAAAAGVALISSGLMFSAGTVWFLKKDL